MIKFQPLMFAVVLLMAHSGFAQPATGENSHVALSKTVQDLFEKKRSLIEKEVAGNPLIIEEVKKYNEKNKDISLEEIKKMDQRWIASQGVTDFMKEFLTGPNAEFLIAFQESQEGIVEMFITDAKGLNVVMTNKTSDYYQADEDWWVKCYADGRGLSYSGDIEYDESAMSESIPVFVPIKDPERGQVIGVIKTIIDIASIQRELQ